MLRWAFTKPNLEPWNRVPAHRLPETRAAPAVTGYGKEQSKATAND